MPNGLPHKWQFKARFRRHAFGWRSQPAMQRLREALAEIRKAARQSLVIGAEGGVTLIERLSPAIEQVDSSSGAIGSAVYVAIEELAGLISDAPAPPAVREVWIERLWQAFNDDEIPYLETSSPRRAAVSRPTISPWTRRARRSSAPPGWRTRLTGATASAGLLDEALALASQTPTDPKTLTRAARDHVEEEPEFALGAGMTALRWLAEGYGYEVTGADVWSAFANTMNAAQVLGREQAVRGEIRALVESDRTGFLAKVIGRELGMG